MDYQVDINPGAYKALHDVIYANGGRFQPGLTVNGDIVWPRYRVTFFKAEDCAAFKELLREVENRS